MQFRTDTDTVSTSLSFNIFATTLLITLSIGLFCISPKVSIDQGRIIEYPQLSRLFGSVCVFSKNRQWEWLIANWANDFVWTNMLQMLHHKQALRHRKRRRGNKPWFGRCPQDGKMTWWYQRSRRWVILKAIHSHGQWVGPEVAPPSNLLSPVLNGSKKSTLENSKRTGTPLNCMHWVIMSSLSQNTILFPSLYSTHTKRSFSRSNSLHTLM